MYSIIYSLGPWTYDMFEINFMLSELSFCSSRCLLLHTAWDFRVLIKSDMTSLGMSVLMCNVSGFITMMFGVYTWNSFRFYCVLWFYPHFLLIAELFIILVSAFVDLVHSTNGTTQREDNYGVEQDHESKTIRSSRKREKKNVSAVPSHFVQTDVSRIKGETSMFSDMVFCILNYHVNGKMYSGFLAVLWY